MDLFQPLLNPLFWFQPTWDLDPPCCFSVTKSCLTLWTTWTQWTTAYQASLSFTISQRLLKVMSIESVMPFNHLILCHPLLLLPSIFTSIRIFSSDLTLHIGCPNYWSLSFRISSSNKYSGIFPLGWTGLISLLSKGF